MEKNVDRTFYHLMAFAIFPVLAVVFNSFVAAAALRSWKKLRNSSIYMYVFSMVVANNVYGLTAVVSLTSYLLKNNSLKNICKKSGYDDLTGFEKWWTVTATFQLTIFLLLGCNVLALISGMHKNPHLWGPSSLPLNPKTSRVRSLQLKQRRAIVVTIVAWVIPILPGLLVAANEWYCFNNDKRGYCSQLLSPICRPYIASVALFWGVIVFAILGCIIFTWWRLNKMIKDDGGSRSNNSDLRTPNGVESAGSLDSRTGEKNPTSEKGELPGAEIDSACDDQGHPRASRSYGPMQVLKPLLWIFVSFVATFLPSVVIFVMDAFAGAGAMSDRVGLGCYAIGLVYCIASPAILLQYLPGLRGACHHMMARMLCSCCVTVTVSKRELRRASIWSH